MRMKRKRRETEARHEAGDADERRTGEKGKRAAALPSRLERTSRRVLDKLS